MMHFQSLDEVVAAVRRRFWIMAGIVVLGCILSVYFALNQTRIYEATAVVQIEDAQVSGTGESEARDGLDARRTVRLIEQRVMARGSLLEIMETHGLFQDDPSMTLTNRISEMRQATSVEAILSGESWQPDASASGLVITVQLDDAEKAAAVANDILERVMEEARQRSVDRARTELDFFIAEEARMRQEIGAAEARVAAYKTANAEFLPAGAAALQAELTTLNAARLQLRQQVLELRSNASRLRPDDLERQVAVLEDQIELVSARIDEVNAVLAKAPAVERELLALERELSQLNEQYALIARRKAEAEMSQNLEEQRQLERFEVLERAIAPDYPISRSRKQTAIMGGVASVLAALGVGFLLELLNPAIRSSAQMERILGIRPVVTIPTLKSTRGGALSRRGGRIKFALGAVVGLMIAGVALLARIAADRLEGMSGRRGPALR